ncbi:MAG: AtpZ/AtpI family protein [Propionibacterium sp.]
MSSADDGRVPATTGDAGMQSLSYLISGIVLYGGLGWFADRFLHTGWLLPAGLLLGAAAGIYLVIKRFGSGA